MNCKRLIDGLEVVLSRRNLQSLLAKLDGHPPDSAATLINWADDGSRVVVRGQEDASHYNGRVPGPMHIETEAMLPQEWQQCPCYSESPSYPVEKWRVIVNRERHEACRSCMMLLGLTDDGIDAVVENQ